MGAFVCSNRAATRVKNLGKALRRKYAHLQPFCKHRKGPAKYDAAFARRRSGVRIPSAPLQKYGDGIGLIANEMPVLMSSLTPGGLGPWTNGYRARADLKPGRPYVSRATSPIS